MKIKIPIKFENIFKELENSRLSIFEPGNGDMGYFARLEKNLNGDICFFFDKKKKKTIAIRQNNVKIKKKGTNSKHMIIKILI